LVVGGALRRRRHRSAMSLPFEISMFPSHSPAHITTKLPILSAHRARNFSTIFIGKPISKTTHRARDFQNTPKNLPISCALSWFSVACLAPEGLTTLPTAKAS
jgi:hypothetical protein